MKTFLKYLFVAIILFAIFSILGGIYKAIKPTNEQDVHEANIGVLEVRGVITESLPILDQLEEFKKNKNLKALVVRIDSPGGGVGASQEIYMELKKLRGQVPVIVSMGDIAASGGLYVSLGGDVIVALPGTLTGSMGVLLQLTSFSRLLEKLYVDPATIRSGDLKDAGNPTKPLDPKAKAYLETLVKKNFAEFKRAVQTERKLSNETVELLSDGRVVDGQQAVTLKLVDELGTFRDAVQIAKEKAKIKGDAELYYLSRKPKSFFERIFSEASTPLRDWMRSKVQVLQYKWEPVP